jgi:type VI protein secretion system component VasK
MPTNDAHPTTEPTDLRQENRALRTERDEYRKALYAVLWQNVTPPTAEELATAEPARPWLDELIDRLEKSDGD